VVLRKLLGATAELTTRASPTTKSSRH
jgi:hypothetical protein